MTPQTISDQMAAVRRQRFERQRRQFRQDYPRASSLTLCAREIYHQMSDPDRRPEFSVELLQRFRRGHEVETLVVRELLEDGWDVLEAQRPFEIKEEIDGVNTVICTGHIDGRLGNCIHAQAKPIFEVKSMHVLYWNKVNEAADFWRHGGFWARYPLQLLMYCYAYDEPWGLFILDDCMGHQKAIPIVLEDWLDETEAALRRCRAAVIGKRKAEPPDYCGDVSVCRECWCRQAGLCMPPMDFTDNATGIIEDVDTVAALDRMDELKAAHDEYAALDRPFKDGMKARGAGEYVCGNFLIRTKEQQFARFNIPDDVKDKYKDKGTKVITKWERVTPAPAGA